MKRDTRPRVELAAVAAWTVVLAMASCFHFDKDRQECQAEGRCENTDAGQPKDDGPVDAGDGGEEPADGGTVDAGVSPDGGSDGGPSPSAVCTGNWCWENPLPQANNLWAVRTFGPEDVWVAGEFGTMIHWDGRQWESHSGQAGGSLLMKFWGTAPNDLWVVGDKGVRAHWDGTTWTSHNDSTHYFYRSLTGNDAGNLWALASRAISEWDGSRWITTSNTLDYPYCALSTGPGQLWACNGNSIWEKDGGSWVRIYTLADTLVDSWVRSPTDVWLSSFGLLHRFSTDSSSRIIRETWPAGSRAFWGWGAVDLWLVGGSGVVRFDGGTFAQEFPPGAYALYDVWGTAPDNIWAVGSRGAILRRDSSGWQNQVTSVSGWIGSIASQGHRTFAVGQGGIFVRVDGRRWAPAAAVGSIGTGYLYDVWLDPDGGGGWAVGQSGAYAKLEGDQWSMAWDLALGDMYSVWGTGPSDIWAASSYGIWHNTGYGWTHQLDGGTTLYGIWGTSEGELWAVGDNVIYHRQADGGAFSRESLETTAFLRAVSGSGPADVWTVGRPCRILHRGPSGSWTNAGPDAGCSVDEDFFDVWVTSPGNVWALSRSGLWRRADGGWSKEPRVIEYVLLGIGGDSQNVWLVGDYGTIMKRR